LKVVVNNVLTTLFLRPFQLGIVHYSKESNSEKPNDLWDFFDLINKLWDKHGFDGIMEGVGA